MNGQKIKIGSLVKTPHGEGIIVDEEIFRSCERWGIKLKNSPFAFSVSYYFKEKIT